MSAPFQKTIEEYDARVAERGGGTYLGTYRNWRIYYENDGDTIGLAVYDERGFTLASSPNGYPGLRATIDNYIDREGREPYPPLGEEGPIEPPPPPPENVNDRLIEIYRDIIIYQSFEDGSYYCTVKGNFGSGFSTIPEARAFIDAQIGTKPPEVVEVPSGEGGLGGLFSWLSGFWAGLSKALSDMSASISGIGAALGNLGSTISSGIFGALGGITEGLKKPLQDVGKSALDEALTASSEHSPDPETKAKIEQLLAQLKQQQEKLAGSIHHSEADVEGAPDASANMAVALLGVSLSVEVAGALLDILHPLKKLGAQRISERVIDSIGAAGTIGQIIQMPTQTGLIPPLQHYYNSVYQPLIPSYQDMIEMVVKEVIPLDEFKEKMKLLGYSEDWSQKIWDKHFIPPTLTDILTAWRRGLITEDQVDQLMVLVDLDPRFKEIFDTRKYIDPPLNMVRFMFETGNITAEQVKDQIHLLGYRPEHENMIMNYIVEFQARLWRRRYLVSLSQGFQKGVYTQEQLEQAVHEAEYTPDVAKYIVANALVRREIEGSKVTEEKPKLLGIGDLKKAYISGLMSTDDLRLQLTVRGYNESDINLLVNLLDQEKVTDNAGGRKVALSIPELLNAWRYGEVTEDRMKIELSLRGLSDDEIQILVNTKKKQWGVGGITSEV